MEEENRWKAAALTDRKMLHKIRDRHVPRLREAVAAHIAAHPLNSEHPLAKMEYGGVNIKVGPFTVDLFPTEVGDLGIEVSRGNDSVDIFVTASALRITHT